jgi:hypothetical protein
MKNGMSKPEGPVLKMKLIFTITFIFNFRKMLSSILASKREPVPLAYYKGRQSGHTGTKYLCEKKARFYPKNGFFVLYPNWTRTINS